GIPSACPSRSIARSWSTDNAGNMSRFRVTMSIRSRLRRGESARGHRREESCQQGWLNADGIRHVASPLGLPSQPAKRPIEVIDAVTSFELVLARQIQSLVLDSGCVKRHRKTGEIAQARTENLAPEEPSQIGGANGRSTRSGRDLLADLLERFVQ